MDSTTMIAVAIVTGIIAIAVVTIKRWMDQYRLEQMRKSVEHIDSINLTSNVGSSLRPWLSVEALRALAELTQFHAQQVNTKFITMPPRTSKALDQAEEWRNNVPPPVPSPLPTQPKQAKELRDSLMNYLELIKGGHKEHVLTTEAARERIREATVLNARICANTYQARAKQSLAQNAPNQALHFLKRAEKTIRNIKDLPQDLMTELDALVEAIDELEQHRASSGPSRLAEGAEELAEAEESWKKKTFD